jgi:hypothetical protein
VPFPLWIATIVAIGSSLVIRWLQFCKITGAPLRGAVGAAIAYQALTHIITLSSLRAVLGHPPEWQRTDKFPPRRRSRALSTARTETLIALAFLAAALATYTLGYGGITTMLAIGFTIQALTYLCAPLLAWIITQDVKQASAHTSDLAVSLDQRAA